VNEQQLADRFSGAVAGEPPLGFDPDDTVDRAARRSRNRRATMGVATATGVVALTAVAVVNWSGMTGAGRGGTIGMAAPAAPTPVTTAWPPPGAVAPAYTAEQLRQRGREMTGHLSQIFGQVVPGTTGIVADPATWGGEGGGAAGIVDGQTYLNGPVEFERDGVQGGTIISVYMPGEIDKGPGGACEEEPKTCTVTPLPDGSAVEVKSSTHGGDAQLLVARHFRPNGTVVAAIGYNYDPVGQHVYAPEVAMTGQELTTLATDPALSL